MIDTQDKADTAPLRFIVIDDDRVSNIVSKLMILKYKADSQIEVFTDPEIALDRIKQIAENVDDAAATIVLLDINMPLMSGWDFLEEFTRLGGNNHQQFTIFMLSSSLDKSDIERAGRHPLLSGFFSKPLSVKCLLETLDHLTEKY